jgi:hypothetical protein
MDRCHNETISALLTKFQTAMAQRDEALGLLRAITDDCVSCLDGVTHHDPKDVIESILDAVDEYLKQFNL